MRKAIVIGAGIAGIAAAIRLSQKNYTVHVYESNNYPGGKLTSFQKGLYSFDAGPSLFTLPHLVTELFELCGENPNAHFEYKKLDSVCNYFWEDGTRFQMKGDLDTIVEDIHNAFDEPKSQVRKYLKSSQQKYELTSPIFLENSLHKISSLFNRQVFKALMQTHKLGVFSTLDSLNRKQFSDPKLIQLFNRFATYNGSSPYKTPGIMSMIPHLEMNIGTFFPKGGMRSITDSLVDLAQRQGVTFHYNNKIEQIVHDGQKVTGVKVNEDFIGGDLVVANMDVHAAYTNLLQNVKPPKRILAQERSSSALIFYWGIRKSFSDLSLHNILFSDAYQEEFDCIFNCSEIHEDPTVYINISSKYNTTDAPKDCENWFVMINVPSDTGQDWDAWIAQAKASILAKIKRILHVDIESLIECEEILDPRKIASKTSSYQGSLYGTASNNRFAAFLRHANFSNQIDSLYFCGGSVHPGGGIPLCLNSAKIVSNLID